MYRKANRKSQKLSLHQELWENYQVYLVPLPALVAQLDVPPTGDQEVAGSIPAGRDQQHSFVEIDHEIFSMVILSLTLIQQEQLSVSGERMCTILVNRLEDVLLDKLTTLDMTPLG